MSSLNEIKQNIKSLDLQLAKSIIGMAIRSNLKIFVESNNYKNSPKNIYGLIYHTKRKFAYVLLALILVSVTSCSKESISDPISLETSSVIENVDDAEFLMIDESALFKIINDHRIAIGQNSLEFSSAAYLAAAEHNGYMIAKGEINHDNFSNRAGQLASKTNANLVVENVAKDYATIESVFEAWLDSPNHRKNIEGNFTHSALSIKQDATGNFYFTQIFYN